MMTGLLAVSLLVNGGGVEDIMDKEVAEDFV